MDEYIREFDDANPPSVPVIIMGRAEYPDGELIEDGVYIEAVIDGYQRGDVLTEERDYNGATVNYSILVPAEGLHKSEIGKEVTFYIDDILCEGSHVIQGVGDIANLGICLPYVEDIMEPHTVPEPMSWDDWLTALESVVNVCPLYATPDQPDDVVTVTVDIERHDRVEFTKAPQSV